MSHPTPTTPLQRLQVTLKKEWFLVAMFGAVILASLAPQAGRSGGPLHMDTVTNIGIAIVFFLHGLGISFTALRDGMSRWKVHLSVQLFTFALFPVIWLGFDALVGRWLPAGLGLGFLYLCVLPSTVSSSVALTGVARGNVPAAIFNATLSGLIGIVATPALVALLADVSSQTLSFADAVIGIAKLLLLPLVAGQLLRPWLHAWHHRHKKLTTLVDRWAILLMVYGAFCDSVASGLWRDHGIGLLLAALVGSAVILAVVLALTTWTARRLGFTTEDEITTVFCGSKKTLASGMPMAKLIFGAHPALGVIVLPIMFYHQIQLVICSIMANRYAARP
ncbi:MAG TPA: bile acid:sodium symporter family protein [Rhodocyclaceae bacterium]|nr:bile acid:sodium symporter family protein [Rhodocyclaceae bacterium]